MIDFENEQDEVNFWGKDRAQTLFKIKRLQQRIEKENKHLKWLEDALANYEEVNIKADIDEKAIRQVSQAEYDYRKLFEKYSYVRDLHRKRLWEHVFGRPATEENLRVKYPKLKHRFWWVLHNVVAHIAIGLLPCRFTFRLHDWTSTRLNMPWKIKGFWYTETAPSDEEILKIANQAKHQRELIFD